MQRPPEVADGDGRRHGAGYRGSSSTDGACEAEAAGRRGGMARLRAGEPASSGASPSGGGDRRQQGGGDEGVVPCEEAGKGRLEEAPGGGEAATTAPDGRREEETRARGDRWKEDEGVETGRWEREQGAGAMGVGIEGVLAPCGGARRDGGATAREGDEGATGRTRGLGRLGLGGGGRA